MKKLIGLCAVLVMLTGVAQGQNYPSPHYHALTVDGAIAGDVSGANVTATGPATTGRTAGARASDALNLRDFGAPGGGLTDDTTAISNCLALIITINDNGTSCFVPEGKYKTTLATGAFAANAHGQGQIYTGTLNTSPLAIRLSGDPRAPFYSSIIAPPLASIGNGAAPTAWGRTWGSDISYVQFPVEHHVSGATTLGQPASGYLWTPEASPFLVAMSNSSGWNNDNGDNGGRTGVAAFKTILTQQGQGDLVGYNVEAACQSTRAGATSFLASPACIIANGDVSATVAGAYLNATEYNLSDAGHDVAGIGQVMNMVRTVGTGALGATWIGGRMQSLGTAPVDAFYSVVGPSKIGIDLSTATLTSNQAAVTLAANQRIYLNATNTDPNHFPNGTNPGTMWVDYDSTTSKIVIGNGTTRLLSIDPTTGNVIAKGTFTPSGTP